jgi:hypothetical protein
VPWRHRRQRQEQSAEADAKQDGYPVGLDRSEPAWTLHEGRHDAAEARDAECGGGDGRKAVRGIHD